MVFVHRAHGRLESQPSHSSSLCVCARPGVRACGSRLSADSFQHPQQAREVGHIESSTTVAVERLVEFRCRWSCVNFNKFTLLRENSVGRTNIIFHASTPVLYSFSHTPPIRSIWFYSGKSLSIIAIDSTTCRVEICKDTYFEYSEVYFCTHV